MKDNLKVYLQSLFTNARNTARNSALFEELLGNLHDRYDELIAEGQSPADAYAKAIGELGDIDPLIEKNEAAPDGGTAQIFHESAEEKRTPPPLGKKKQLSAEALCRAKHSMGLAVAIAVMLYIIWLAPTVLVPWGVVFLFLCVAVATSILILIGNRIPPYVDDSALTYGEELRAKKTRLAHILIALGVGLCIVSITPVVLIQSEWGVALMFTAIALGVGAIVYASHVMPATDSLANRPGYQPLQGENPPERGEKKPNRWLVPIILVAAALMICSCIWAGFNGVSFGLFGIEGRPLALYVNEGDASVEMTLEQLDIQWTAGSVRLEYYEGSTVELVETQHGQPVPAGEERMRWYRENGALHVRFDGRSDIRFYWGKQPQKDLVVRIPMDAVLSAVELELVSAKLEMRDIQITAGAGVLDIDTVSGAIMLQGVLANKADLDAVSAIQILTDCDLDVLCVDTVSGNVTLQSSTVGRVDFTGISAGFASNQCVHGIVEIDTTSGDVDIMVGAALRQIEFDTTSGDMELHLEADVTGFTARLDSTSGDFECSLATSYRNGAHIYGDGALQIEMDSTSGDLTVMG